MKKITFTLQFIFIILMTIDLNGQSNNIHELNIDTLNLLSKKFCKSDFDSAYFYAEKALRLSDEINYPEGKIAAIINLGETKLAKGEIDSSVVHFNRALSIGLENEKLSNYTFYARLGLCKVHYYRAEYPEALIIIDKALEGLSKHTNFSFLASALNMKALIYKRTGKLEDAQHNFIDALQNADLSQDTNMSSIILTNLGIINRNLKQYDNALKYYEQALIYLELLEDTFGIGMLYQNMAALYSDIGEHTKSLEFNFKAKVIIEKNNYQNINYATLLNNIGLDFYSLHQYEQAIEYYNQALQLSVKLDDTYGIADTKINLGKTFFAKDNMYQAKDNIIEGIHLAKSIEADDIAIEGYKALVECEIASNNYKDAYLALISLNSLRDSVYNIEKVNVINELQEKYESEKKDLQIEKQELALEKARAATRFYIIIAMLTLLGSFIMIWLYRAKQKSYKKLAEKNYELATRSESPKSANWEKDISQKHKDIYLRLQASILTDHVYTDIDLTIESLAKKLGTNRTDLSESIRLIMQTSYPSYINDLRIKHAIRLLSVPGEKPTLFSVSLESGFKSESNFYKQFKLITGLKPLEFIKQQGNIES